MIQFHSYRKSLLRRRSLGLRHAVILTGAFILAYNILTAALRDDTGVVRLDVITAAPTAFVAPQPNIIEKHDTETASIEEETAAVKPQVAAAIEPSLTEQLSSIQDNITSMLEASNALLVSEKKVVVSKGDTLMDLLVKKAAMPREEAYQVVQALSKVYNPRDLKTGGEITVFFHKDPAVADPKFSGLRIEKDIINAVTVNRAEDGHLTIDKEEKDIHLTLKAYKGTINNSLYVDAQAAGVPDGVILDMIKMYSWNVDFQREIQGGDKFEVMYEEYRTEDGKVVPGKGNIVYAKLALSGDGMPFYRFKDKKGETDYYDDDGRSAKKPLMKTPIDGARLSSGYGMRRHPVLGYSKMHRGVDFAASRGTPIYAAGDGVIAKMGPFSTYGNYIRIRHRAGLETAYAHMKNFKNGLHTGNRVKQGDVIGYVGTTGRSTGPHLHYEVILNNAQVNPAAVKAPTGKALKGQDMRSFKAMLGQTRSAFNSLSRHTTVADNRRGGTVITDKN